MSVMSWLKEGDPAIRWQVMWYLEDEPPAVVASERARIGREGWGAELLAAQNPQGYWGGEEERRHWMTTIHTLAHLKNMGADPAAPELREALDRVRTHITWWQLDGRPFFEGETEPCLNGQIVAAGAYFGADVDKLVDRLLSEQLADGGWNCNAPPSIRSSFHSTICVLEGLIQHERARGATAAVTDARARGEEFLLSRRMMRRLSTGEIIDRQWTRFAFPTRWHYDVLRGLDYLRSAGVEPDERVQEALDLVEKRRHQNGRWPLNILHPDRIPHDMEPGQGKASRWITLRALRVLDWAGRS
jgi:hypothetical protein